MDDVCPVIISAVFSSHNSEILAPKRRNGSIRQENTTAFSPSLSTESSITSARSIFELVPVLGS